MSTFEEPYESESSDDERISIVTREIHAHRMVEQQFYQVIDAQNIERQADQLKEIQV